MVFFPEVAYTQVSGPPGIWISWLLETQFYYPIPLPHSAGKGRNVIYYRTIPDRAFFTFTFANLKPYFLLWNAC